MRFYYEYYCIKVSPPNSDVDWRKINRLAAQGWEVCQTQIRPWIATGVIEAMFVVLRRPVEVQNDQMEEAQVEETA
jgi:hypothetical protein